MPSVNNQRMPEVFSTPNGLRDFTTPPGEDFNTETMQGSIQQMLADNIGVYVVCEFLMGTSAALARKQGYIHSVGRSYLVLYEDQYNHYILCDIFSIKFVTFYPPGQRPPMGFNNTNYPNAR